MSRRSYQCLLGSRLFFCLLLVAASASSGLAQEAETTSSKEVSGGTVVEEAAKNTETKSSTIKEDAGNKGAATAVNIKDEDTKAGAALDEMRTAVLRVNVLQLGEDNQPIMDARVIVTYDNGKEYEYKTNEAGVALLSGLPYGKVDVDVTSSGRQSDGGTLVLDEPEEALIFHLKPRALVEEGQ
ncbi:hypothetical protein [Kaarinaea lacus]